MNESADDDSLDRDQVILRMVQLARSGRVPDAQEVLRTYLKDHSTDGTMHYNLTCLDLLLSQKDLAFADLENALDNGYTNFRLMGVDPDLDLLRDDPRFESLLNEYKDSFIEDFQSRAIFLEEGYPPQMVDLLLQSTSGNNLKPQASVAFNAEELLVTLVVDDLANTGGKPPWEGGCGVLVNLVHPVSPDDYDSRRFYSYGFFVRDGEAQATLVGRHKEVLLEPMPQLNPAISRQENETTYQIAIPWDFFEPYAPSLDPEMGLNVFYFSTGEGTSQPVYSLMPEKKTALVANSWRRYIPVSFLDSDRSTARLRGRLYNRLTEGVEVGLQLAFWSEAEGAAQCRFTFHPQDESSAALGGESSEAVFCEEGLNLYNFEIDLSHLPDASLALRVELEDANGRLFARDIRFDNFQENWLGLLNERVHQLKGPEQSTLKYYLFLLTRLAEIRHPQSDASHIHPVYTSMVDMIALSEAGKSCLPDEGLFQSGFTTGTMTMRSCSMYLPKGFKQENNLKLLMVLPSKPQTEDILAQTLGEALGRDPGTIILVPQSHGYSSLNTERAARETILAMEWATQLFGEKKVTLVGLGDGADAAMSASLLGPEFCHEVLLDGSLLYRELKDVTTASVTAKLGSTLNQLPYSIVSSGGSSSQTQLIQATMHDLGYKIHAIMLEQETLDTAWIARWFGSK